MYWAVSFAVLQVQRALGTIFTLFIIRIIIINLLSPLRLHTVSSIQIPESTNRYNSMLPSVYVSPLKLYLATKISLHGISGPPFLAITWKFAFLLSSHLSIIKCNAKMCSCCKHVCCKYTVKSNVNGRQFSVLTNSDLDWGILRKILKHELELIWIKLYPQPEE